MINYQTVNISLFCLRASNNTYIYNLIRNYCSCTGCLSFWAHDEGDVPKFPQQIILIRIIVIFSNQKCCGEENFLNMVSPLLSLSLEFYNCQKKKKSNTITITHAFMLSEKSPCAHSCTLRCHCHTAGKTASSVLKPGHIHYLHVTTIIRCVSILPVLSLAFRMVWCDSNIDSWVITLFSAHGCKSAKQTHDRITSLQKTTQTFLWHLDFILYLIVINVCCQIEQINK